MSPQYETDPAEKYLSLNWDWRFFEVTEDGETYFEAKISEIPDFAAYGSDMVEVAANAREALLSHLRGYLVTAKRIPIPGRAKTSRYVTEERVALAGI
jgi:predicted RNase H-like HicB family nuclease